MKFYFTKDRRYVATQKDAGKDYTQIEVPTDKDGLMSYLNEQEQKLQRAIVATAQRYGAGKPAADVPEREKSDAEPPLQTPKLPVRETTVATPHVSPMTDVVEAIMDSEGALFGNILSATIERLGELRAKGWDELRKIAARHKSRSSLERGLGFRVLGAGEVREEKTDG